MEVKFDIIKPNLYVVEDEVYFGMDASGVVPIGEFVDEVIKRHIGTLKVKESDIDIIQSGLRSKKTKGKYTVPLEKYLHVLNKNIRNSGRLKEITNEGAKLFGLSYLIDAKTIENFQDMKNWREIKEDLADPEKLFDGFEEDTLVYRLDRKRTLEKMRKLNQELNPKIPDNCAELVVISGYVPSGKETILRKNLGVVSFLQLKAKDKTKIKEAKSELVEKLKEVDGPCLSLDAPEIYRQMVGLYSNAPRLIRRYGDILKYPEWETRLFRLDP